MEVVDRCYFQICKQIGDYIIFLLKSLLFTSSGRIEKNILLPMTKCARFCYMYFPTLSLKKLFLITVFVNEINLNIYC